MIRRLLTMTALACTALIAVVAATGPASAAPRGLRIQHNASAIFLDFPCTSCDFTLPAVRVSFVARCTVGERYFFSGTMVQNGVTIDDTERPLGAGEGVLCETGRIHSGYEFAGASLHPGRASVTITATLVPTGATVATDAAGIRVPRA